MSEAIEDDEVFEHSLYHFLQWLEILIMQPKEASEIWGNYNVAWEIVDDLKQDGNSIVSSISSYLTTQQKQEVLNFLLSLETIPQEILVSATTVESNIAAMSHSCWNEYRESAQKLLKVLDSSAARNREYFS